MADGLAIIGNTLSILTQTTLINFRETVDVPILKPSMPPTEDILHN
jgi:hypothetical protein